MRSGPSRAGPRWDPRAHPVVGLGDVPPSRVPPGISELAALRQRRPSGGREREGPAGRGRCNWGGGLPLRGGSGVRRPGEGAGKMTSCRRSAVNLGAAAAGAMWG